MPKLKCTAILFLIALSTSTATQAADTMLTFPLADVLESAEAKQKLDPNIALYFGDEPHGAVAKNLGNFVTNKKTNSFGKNAKTACSHVFLSAAIGLQQLAKAEGGNAVINIESYFKKRVFRSQTEFECAEGTAMAGVALRGDVVTLKKP